MVSSFTSLQDRDDRGFREGFSKHTAHTGFIWRRAGPHSNGVLSGGG
jgi:hypothetical protein